MPFIKVISGVVEVGGLVTPTPEDSDWFMYEGYIPQAQILAWDDVNKKVIVHPDALEEVKLAKLASINKSFELEQSVVDAQFPEREQASWCEQAREAREYTIDPTTEITLLNSIAAGRGIPVDLLVGKILDKSKKYSSLLGSAIGKRQALEDIINNVSTLPEDAEASIKTINELTWENYPPTE